MGTQRPTRAAWEQLLRTLRVRHDNWCRIRLVTPILHHLEPPLRDAVQVELVELELRDRVVEARLWEHLQVDRPLHVGLGQLLTPGSEIPTGLQRLSTEIAWEELLEVVLDLSGTTLWERARQEVRATLPDPEQGTRAGALALVVQQTLLRGESPSPRLLAYVRTRADVPVEHFDAAQRAASGAGLSDPQEEVYYCLLQDGTEVHRAAQTARALG